MLAKRIIPCLDVRDGRTVKGINFIGLRDAGDPVELGAAYAACGADELVFLDITATVEGRSTFSALVEKIARRIDIPFTVGGGIRTDADVDVLLSSGADKISVNSAAVRDPALLERLARRYGSQCVVCAVDARRSSRFRLPDGEDGWEVYLDGGRTPAGMDALSWVREAAARGAGEILLTSMDKDGTKDGFDIELTRKVASSCSVPVIASGGAGNMEHFFEVFDKGCADAALAASIFHFHEVEMNQLKIFLREHGIVVRIPQGK
ncbi:imidazole glycerol phosphate synthase subunit HisF [Parasphaerochaeta coccoides]|uniref:Imidazole glycerol phosphate synthase subunit HisF n=1 Tax=Parasphaerochaeta coccoides (strain ATCC BAA-1237 / DSM 17374 / SPN1) TaxID=760011 RepID=F4GI27_PARC1|nr:imidazole glycerol phosphate synthase subunit HisF [Parasphaerochaeta coccoides]AEC02625.1 Imidazole glycerol phosphate synthase subunit hisF [Parasphaerochaeta coccoides DSM 17374]